MSAFLYTQCSANGKGSSRVLAQRRVVNTFPYIQYMDGLSPRVAYAHEGLCMYKHTTGIVKYMDVGWIKPLRRHAYAETR